MATKREFTTSPDKPMPRGYAFLCKGNQYKTLHCRRLTHEAGKPLYVVKEHKKVVGIRIPKSVFIHVQSLARETLASRRSATEQRDAALIRRATAEMNQQFPNAPSSEREAILNHGFRKHSGRVGRAAMISLEKRVLFAVIAHIRHKHTAYDELLKDGKKRKEARRLIAKQTQEIMRQWGARKDYTWYFTKEEDDTEDAEDYSNQKP